MKPRGFMRIELLGAMALIAGSALCAPGVRGAETSSATNRQPRVLVLYSNERLLPAGMAVDEAIRGTLEAELEASAEFYTEFLDVERFPGEAQQERTRRFLSDKYLERPPDVIIAGGSSALNFLIRYRATLFPRVPVVHCGVTPHRLPTSLPDDLIVGTPHAVIMADTLKLALRLQPDTRQVALLGDGDSVHPAPGLLASLATNVSFLRLTNRSIPELRDELSRLPKRTVVFYGTMFRDASGNTFTPRAALEQFSPASRAPIYGYYDTYLGHGIVGGSMITYQTIARTAARTAIRILKGETPQAAVRGAVLVPTPMFDWRELKRWNIDESRLPPGNVLLFRPQTLWENHKWAILSGVALFVLEAGLIAGLILQLRRRQRAEAVARESERTARELSGRLIHTQEEERSRIARDLHDDFNQRLALLSVEIDLLGRKPSGTDSAAKLQQLGEQARELSSDVHRLAYQLHPAKLDQLGLVAAVNGLCRDLSKTSGLKVDFTHDNISRDLPTAVARCGYRVIQESLQNIVRHSGVSAARVELAARHGHLRLAVSDEGQGFDPEATRKAAGLGLLSMRERVRLLQGKLEIHSEPGRGTRVELTIPMQKEETLP